MNEMRLNEIINELNREISKEGAIVVMRKTSAGFESHFIANRQGYLRLGVECLRAATIPINQTAGGEFIISVDMDYLIGPGDMYFRMQERREDLNREELSKPKPAHKKRWTSKVWSCLGTALTIVGILIPWLIGVGTFWSWVL